MFAIFKHFPLQWSWKHLPLSLTEGAYMRLETAVIRSDVVTPESVQVLEEDMETGDTSVREHQPSKLDEDH